MGREMLLRLDKLQTSSKATAPAVLCQSEKKLSVAHLVSEKR